MSRAQTVLFTFDAPSLAALDRMVEDGGYADRAECLHESLEVNRALIALAAQGFTEVIVRRPHGGRREQELIIPRLRRINRRARKARKARR